MEENKLIQHGGYEQKIMDILRGNTPQEKYNNLLNLLYKSGSNKDFLDSLNYRIKEHLKR